MTSYLSLDDYLATWAKGDALRQPVAATVAALAAACKDIAELIAAGPLEGQLSKLRNDKSGGDFQTELDILANAHLIEALWRAPVAAVASEELDVPVSSEPGRALDRRARSARRLLQHRHQRLGRHDFLAATHSSRRRE